jgi:hypothetical protein
MFNQQLESKTYRLILASFLALCTLGGGATAQAQANHPNAGNTSNEQSDTISIRVGTSSDDAEELVATGEVTLDNVDLEMVLDRADEQVVGLRFADVGIPQGATITDAYVQFTVDETDGQPVTIVIQAEAIDNSSTFTSTTNNISSRPRTATKLSWSPEQWSAVGEAGADQQTPNLAAVIQEVTDRPGWVSGNALSILLSASSGASRRTAIAYDQSPTSAPLLVVEYELGNQPPPDTKTLFMPKLAAD